MEGAYCRTHAESELLQEDLEPMCLHPRPVDPVPEETARVARAAFPKGTTYMTMRDTLGAIFEDEDFAHLFPVAGSRRWHRGDWL
jgi:hypothetical protein